MSSPTVATGDSIIRSTVVNFLTPERISTIATRAGYDSKASFLPGEFETLLDKTTLIVLKKVKENLEVNHHSVTSEESLQREVSSLVEEELKKVCTCVPQDTSFPEVIPTCVQKWFTSLIYPTSDA